MKRRRRPSAQTRAVLAALAEEPDRKRHGYELAKLTGLPSGTLYPLLIRLAERGYLESEWEDAAVPGRPPRHVYRLTPSGRQYAVEASRNEVRNAAPRPAGETT
jgi:PadR family transcriptional regulator PadR